MNNEHNDFMADYFNSFHESAKINKDDMTKILWECDCVTNQDKQLFSEAGVQSDRVGIVVSGLFVSRFINHKNLPEVSDLHCKGYSIFVGDVGSLLTGNVAQSSIRSEGKSVIMEIDRGDFYSFCNAIPALSHIFRMMIYASGNEKIQLLKSFDGKKSDAIKNIFDNLYPDITTLITRVEFAEFINHSVNSFSKS